MSGRRGVSLVELMLTMSALTVILTISAALIHRAMHAQSKSRLFFDVERSAQRLSESFRRDVHAASVAATGDAADGGVLLRLEMAGGQSVEYRQAAGRVERLWHVDDRVRAREAFVFSADTRLTAEQEPPRLVILSIVPSADVAGQADRPLLPYAVPVSLRAAAVLGRNASLVDAADQPEKSP
jgi:hypothetical protein